MAFEQVRIRDLRPGDRVLPRPEPPFDPEYGDVVAGYASGEMRLRQRGTVDERTVHIVDQDLILRIRDRMPVEEVQAKDLQTGDLVLESRGPALADDSFHLYEVLSYRNRWLTLRLAINPPADGIRSPPEDLGSYVNIEYDPEELVFRNPPVELVPGVRFDCPKYHQITVASRKGHLVQVFVGSLPDAAPMPRAEFLMAIPQNGSGWFAIPMFQDGKLRRCLKCGSQIGRVRSAQTEQSSFSPPGPHMQGPPEPESV